MNKPTFNYEEELLDRGYTYILGIDEAGRGPLAGPVFASAVKIEVAHLDTLLKFVKDSKKISPKKRLEIADFIMNTCKWSVATASAKEIDELNILEATKLAMVRAATQHKGVDYALIDGNMDLSNHFLIGYESIIKGDAKVLSIAAASILAKTAQVNYMFELDKKYPQYCFSSNHGYGTKIHCENIIKYGVIDEHRKTFKRVREYV